MENRTYDLLDEYCPSRQALTLIAEKWVVLVIYALARHDVLRYGELQRTIGGISQKMLTQTLRRMENNGFVHRIAHPTVPPTVEYTLTPLGQSLLAPIAALKDWAENHLHEIPGIVLPAAGGESGVA